MNFDILEMARRAWATVSSAFLSVDRAAFFPAFEFTRPYILTLLVALPAIGAVVVLLAPRRAFRFHKIIGLAFTTLVFFLSLFLLRGFQPIANMQFEER